MNDYAYLKHKSSVNVSTDPVIHKFRHRIYAEDNDVFLIIAGARGSTKSGCGISMGYQIDINKRGNTRFYLDKKYIPEKMKLLPGERLPRVIYKPSQLLDMLQHNEKYPMGTCILWDEAGVGGDARDFATKKNKLLKRSFQTIRSLNWFVILTAVTIKDFDVGLNRNAGFYMRTFGKTVLPVNGTKRPYGKTKVYQIDINPLTGVKYTPFLNYRFKNEPPKVLAEHYFVRKPPHWMENPYKRYKALFQSSLYGDYAFEMDNIDNYALDSETKRAIDIVQVKIDEIEKNPGDYYSKAKGRFLAGAIKYYGDVKIKNDARVREILQLLNFKLEKGEIKVD